MEQAAQRVAPGGQLVWSVCSIEPEEGEQRVRGFLQEHPEFELDESFLTLPGPTGAVDGGFAARLRRTKG